MQLTLRPWQCCPRNGAQVEATIATRPNASSMSMIDGQHAQKVQTPRGPTFASNLSTCQLFGNLQKLLFNLFQLSGNFCKLKWQTFYFFQFFGNLQKLLWATYGLLESNLRPCGGVLRQTVVTFWPLTKVAFR